MSTKKKITYKKAVQELEEILTEIKQGEIDVDKLSEKIKRAYELIEICQDKIKKAEVEVKKITENFEKSD